MANLAYILCVTHLLILRSFLSHPLLAKCERARVTSLLEALFFIATLFPSTSSLVWYFVTLPHSHSPCSFKCKLESLHILATRRSSLSL